MANSPKNTFKNPQAFGCALLPLRFQAAEVICGAWCVPPARRIRANATKGFRFLVTGSFKVFMCRPTEMLFLKMVPQPVIATGMSAPSTRRSTN